MQVPTVEQWPSAGSSAIRLSSGERAARYIRRLIFGGQLRPGTRIPQDDVAQALGVSRIPVREALIALEREGWVTIELHRGAFVSVLDARAVADHYDLYGVVLGFAAQRALERAGRQLLDDLSTIERDFAKTDDPAELNRLALEFQDTIVDAAASPRLKVVMRAISRFVPGNFFALVPDSVKIERRGLTAIVRAMKKRDGELVVEEYARMMNGLGEKVVTLFKSRGLLDQPDTG
jgi:DNA-binding GntR family transcriptional regulator